MRYCWTSDGRSRVSAKATVEFVVPRSMPIRNALRVISSRAALADVQLQLPAVRATLRLAPELESADFSDAAFERDRDHVFVAACRRRVRAVGRQRHFQGPEFLELVAPVFDDGPRRIVLPDRGAQKAELRGDTDGEPELLSFDRRAGPLFHPERHDAESFQRRLESGHGGHRALDSDVIAARCAAANADTVAARPGTSVVRGPASDSMLEVRRIEHVRRLDRRKPLLREPPVQYADNPRAQLFGLEHPAVEQHVCR